MWTISKAADRRTKRTKIWDSGYYSEGYLMPDSLSLVWGHSAHFAKFPILQFLNICSSPNFHPIHPKFIQGILIIQAVTFLMICQALKNYLWHFEIFHNTGQYAAENFKVLFLPQFSLEPIQTLSEHWLPW